MCICVYVYMCICVYVYMCICVNVYMCICVYVCVCMGGHVWVFFRASRAPGARAGAADAHDARLGGAEGPSAHPNYLWGSSPSFGI